MSIPALVAALRHESVTDSTIYRVLAAALGVDEATARAYAEGQPTAPITDIGALHELLADAKERSDWPAFVALIERISALESDAPRRARYFYTMATVQRGELKDLEAALESLDQALDCDPSMQKAFETQRLILTEQRDWKRLERAHRKMIHRVRGDAAQEFPLWEALALIYRDRLNLNASAIEAFKMALQLRPDAAGILDALRELGG